VPELEGSETPAVPAELEPLRSEPGRAGILLDVDGTLATIVPRPDEAAVPDETRELLRRLAHRYALVACVSGRRAVDARRIVGLEELAYSGNHGFELLMPGDAEPRPDPSLDGHHEDAPRFVASLDRDELDRAGLRIEDKGAIVALHWRGAPNEGEAESLASEIAAEAEWQGLIPHRGRKVLEIRPNVPINKGIAVAAMVASRPLRAALYAGDDRTDLDAFTALRTLRDDGELEVAVCVAVEADEAPPEIAEAADVTASGIPGVVEMLRTLA
jgi:trehalose 6-phosphate phosphatase